MISIKMKPLTLGIITALTLSGCVVKPVEIPRTEIIDGSNSDVATLHWEQGREILGLTLEEAIARAIKFNRQRHVALMESALQMRNLDMTRFDMLPALSANAGYQHRNKLAASSSGVYDAATGTVTSSNPPSYSVSSGKETSSYDLSLTCNTLDFGRSYVRAQQQADRVLISQERERKALHNLSQEIRVAYYKALSAQKLVQKVAPLTSRVDQALSDSRHIEALSLQSPMDALSYQRDLLDIRRSLEVLQKELVTAHTQLALLMGVKPTTRMQLEDVAASEYEMPEVKIDIETLEKTALALRPELVELHYQKRITHKEGKAALISLLPGINLSVSTAHDDSKYLLNNDWTSNGATVSLNLLNAYKLPALKQQLKSKDVVLQERRLALTAAVMSQVHISNIEFEQAKQRYLTAKSYAEVVSSIGQHMRAMQASQQVGELQLITEEFSAVLAEVNRDVAYAELQNSYGQIYMSSGLDPLAGGLGDTSVEGISTALKAQFEAWGTGTVDVVSTSLQSQAEDKWKRGGSNTIRFSEETFLLSGSVNYSAHLNSGEPLPEWLVWHGESMTLSGMPPEMAQPLMVTIIATNDYGTRAQDSFELILEAGKVESLSSSEGTVIAEQKSTDSTVAIAQPADPEIEPNMAGLMSTVVTAGGEPIRGTFTVENGDLALHHFMLKANAPTVDGFILSAQGEWSFDPQHAAYSKLAEGEMKTLSVALSVVEPDNQQADLVFEIFMVGGGAAPAAAQAAKI